MNGFPTSPRSALPFRWLIVFALLSLVAAAVLPPARLAAADPPPTSFADEFATPTLDPAWQVVEFTGTRVYGFPFPANHISLTDNPGYLRYYLDPMTYAWGFLNDYQTLGGTYPYDPGLELHRLFSGEHWVFETKAHYYMPYTNGRGQEVHIYFGDGGANTFAVGFQRYRDVAGLWNGVSFGLFEKYGPTFNDLTTLEMFITYEDIYGPPESTYFFRLERDGSTLTASWSPDGMTWTQAFSHNMGTQLDGLQQRLVITGLSWFNSANSYADYDYVRLAPMNEPPDCTQAYPSVARLWPPNHQFVPINVMGVTDPDGDPVSVTVTSIFQDEPVDTFGDGRFTPDGMGVGTATASVRAERAGTVYVPGNGRVYHIGFSAADGQGGTCSGTVLVSVPHNEYRPAIDGGGLYDSTIP